MELSLVIPILIHIFTLAVAFLALHKSRLSLDTSPRKVVNELITLMEEWEERQTRLEGRWKKLNANYASLRAEMRGKRANGSDDEEDDESVDTKLRPGEDLMTYKQRMRRYLAQGKLKHAGE